MSKLTPDERKFLMILAEHSTPLPRSRLVGTRSFLSRAGSKARASCKRQGFAVFEGGYFNGKHYPMGWRITIEGRAALGEQP